MTETSTDIADTPFEVPKRTADQAKLDAVREAVLRDVKTAGQQELDAHFHFDPGAEGAAELKEDFLNKKEGLNIGECFSLLTSEQYFGKVHFVRLAYTDHTVPDASRAIFDDMNDFLRWFKQHAVTSPIKIGESTIDSYVSEPVGDDSVDETNPGDNTSQDGEKQNDLRTDRSDIAYGLEVDRHMSGRRMEYYYVGELEGGDSHRAVVTRTRPFIEARIMVNGVPSDILVYKKTVITLPASMLQNMVGDDNKRRNIPSLFPPQDEAYDDETHDKSEFAAERKLPELSYITMNNIERLMYTKSGDGIVQRVMTAIFAAVEPIKEDV
nr:Unknown Function [uncultured bacterium]